MGKYKSYTIDDFYSRHVTDNNHISYNYKLKVTYKRGIIEEIIGFTKLNVSEIKIHHIMQIQIYYFNNHLFLI